MPDGRRSRSRTTAARLVVEVVGTALEPPWPSTAAGLEAALLHHHSHPPPAHGGAAAARPAAAGASSTSPPLQQQQQPSHVRSTAAAAQAGTAWQEQPSQPLAAPCSLLAAALLEASRLQPPGSCLRRTAASCRDRVRQSSRRRCRGPRPLPPMPVPALRPWLRGWDPSTAMGLRRSRGRSGTAALADAALQQAALLQQLLQGWQAAGCSTSRGRRKTKTATSARRRSSLLAGAGQGSEQAAQASKCSVQAAGQRPSRERSVVPE